MFNNSKLNNSKLNNSKLNDKLNDLNDKLNLLEELKVPVSLRERALRGWLEEAAERQAAEHQAAEHQAAEHQAAEHQAAEHQAAEHQAAEHQAAERQAREAEQRKVLQAQARLIRLLERSKPEEQAQEAAERQAAERRKALQLQAQARLIRLFERPRPEEQAQALQEARRLIELDIPIRGYAQLKQAGIGDFKPFLDDMLKRMGHAPRGHTLEVARTLLHLALEVALQRGYHPFTSEVLFHLPQVVLSAVLWPKAQPETGRRRVQRALKQLQEAGLLAAAARVGNLRDRRTGEPLGWKDGTVFRVRLKPGKARRLSREEIAYPWRDLEADVRQGRTLPRMFQLINTEGEGIRSPLEELIKWALPPVTLKNPLVNWNTSAASRRTAARNALQDVKNCRREERRTFVGEAGTLLARLLSDGQSANLYRALLWGALRRLDRGEDPFEALWAAIDRALVDLEEGFAKRPGALLTSRLKASGLWAFLMEGPQYRVA